jgi:hypothetical protein
MDWKAFFTGVEASWLSVWVRESESLLAFPAIIALHAIGMGLLVGSNIAMDLRVLGFASRIPLSVLDAVFPVMAIGFWVNAASGLLLLLAYPAKALTNPLFYAKLTLIALALVAARSIWKRMPGGQEAVEKPVAPNLKMLAGISLAMWGAAIVAGRFLAYTYTYLSAYDL